MLLARGIGHVLGLAPARARLDFRGRCSGKRRFGRFDDALLAFDLAARGLNLALDRLQPAALGEPARRAGRRMGGDGEAVPAPEVALARYQPLAGLEQRRKARSVAALDDADLGETARKFRRRRHKASQRLDAVRQGWIGRIERRARPAHRRGLIDRRIEIVAERGAERLLVAFGDGERIHHRRPEILVLDRQQLADGLGFGFQPLHAALGGGERSARGVDFLARAAYVRLPPHARRFPLRRARPARSRVARASADRSG